MPLSWLINMISSLFIFASSTRAATSISSGGAIVPNSSTIFSLSYVLETFRRWPLLSTMTSFCIICGLGSYRWKREGGRKHKRERSEEKHEYNDIEDPPLLQKHSTTRSYTTSVYTYTGIRTFHHAHPQANKLPRESGPLPLMVFVHGLGGSIAQFASLLSTLVHVGPCMGIDLPGCGVSQLSPKDWDAYSHEALVELLEVVIQQVCNATETQEVVLIGHSMGCSLSVSLARSAKREQKGCFHVKGIIAICPKVSPIPLDQVRVFRRLLDIPTPIFNAWRNWDQRGGIASASVTRFVGPEAHEDTKKLQLRFNQQSRTETFRRVARGALPLPPKQKGLPGPPEWSQILNPLFVIAGASDMVTPSKEVDIIVKALGRDSNQVGVSLDSSELSSLDSSSSTIVASTTGYDPATQRQDAVLKTTILPAPASHGLIYDLTTYRTLSGLIQEFLAKYVDRRLSLGWQLQTLKESNKWDVKNLAKWQAVEPVSEPIAGVFYALKTLREADDVHSPIAFTSKWNTRIKAVIDISHESPVYDPHGLEEGDVQYHKLPTVSKIPPTLDEVRSFISLVNQLREVGSYTESDTKDDRLIGVHCHYGFNRTGFFICSYLIEILEYTVQGAIDEFQKSRPPGIRHEHFLDTLFVRYCVGLKRAPTL